MKIFRSLLPGIFTCVLAALASASMRDGSSVSDGASDTSECWPEERRSESV